MLTADDRFQRPAGIETTLSLSYDIVESATPSVDGTAARILKITRPVISLLPVPPVTRIKETSI